MEQNEGLVLKAIGINTYKEAIIYLRADCHVCLSEGFEVQARVKVHLKSRSILATLNFIDNGILKPGEAGLSNYAWQLLHASEGDRVQLSHPEPLFSLSHVRSKIYGHTLAKEAMGQIIHDISKGHYSDIHIATFLTACAGGRLSINEIIDMTAAMKNAGESLSWQESVIVDKHSVGGLPGNRTTPIVVPIVTSFGLTMPKTSSRAITSPAGTADVMETMTSVALTLDQVRAVVEKEKGCMVWGGAISLSPVDDILIGIERALDLDSEGQLIASVLSKKLAAGSTHVFIDIPIGESAKVRTKKAANELKNMFLHVANALNLHLNVHYSDGTQPVGRGIGPSLEAHDVIAVLNNDPSAPQDLKEKAITMAGYLIECSSEVKPGAGKQIAREILTSGKAWDKFQRICEAQGGFKQPGYAQYTFDIVSQEDGVVTKIDNRTLAKLAKLAGAPHDKEAGIQMHAHLGTSVEQGMPLFTVCANTPGELNYATNALANMPEIFTIEKAT